jgi:predicted lipid-binding transport protein (Tim44 family)
VAKASLQQLRNSAKSKGKGAAPVKAAAKAKTEPAAAAPAEAPRVRQIHKVGEVNISAYFPAQVKASLRMVQAKTGNNVKDCLAEALRDLFRKHNVPASVELGEGR